ncbi:hypothetical protein SAY87_005946 [Trapa incisa]|uniref:PPPDE domain-containing protein n=1 Tax=Trapa incisa TaxID=236973 RepID=A0AAN7K3M7_9MYRT|nr:hypothetical protein SAY87_005946 [Trapa incisa]
MFCRRSLNAVDGGSVPVYLNVYDLTPINDYTYWVGIGAYHSGVQVHGIEYAFGAHDYPTTGIFEGEPKQCDGFTFRKTILIGKTDLGPAQVRAVMEELAGEFRGNSYNLITKNCNHFCNLACIRLTGSPIPSWVNRLARIGFLCNCVLPASLCSTRVMHHRAEENIQGETAKVATALNKSDPLNTSSSSSSSPSSSRGRSRSRSRRRTRQPSSPWIHGPPPT